jgi:predicted N-acetyltransferase YhbS
MKIGNGDPNFKVHIREYTPDDREACLSIFTSNHDALLESPEAMAEFLEQGTSWFLVAELEGKVVACGGLEISGDTNAARLMFGIVDRERQRLGIGTLLMLTRLTLAPEDEPTALVTLQSLLGTESFYKRFGFERVRPDERRHPETGVPYVDMGLWLTAEQRQGIRETLAACPVTFAEGILVSDA